MNRGVVMEKGVFDGITYNQFLLDNFGSLSEHVCVATLKCNNPVLLSNWDFEKVSGLLYSTYRAMCTSFV